MWPACGHVLTNSGELRLGPLRLSKFSLRDQLSLKSKSVGIWIATLRGFFRFFFLGWRGIKSPQNTYEHFHDQFSDLKTMSTSTTFEFADTPEVYIIKGWTIIEHGPLKATTLTATGIGDIKVVDRFFNLPLDYTHPNGEKIRVFARTLIPINKAKTKEEEDRLPYCKIRLLFISLTL